MPKLINTVERITSLHYFCHNVGHIYFIFSLFFHCFKLPSNHLRNTIYSKSMPNYLVINHQKKNSFFFASSFRFLSKKYSFQYTKGSLYSRWSEYSSVSVRPFLSFYIVSPPVAFYYISSRYEMTWNSPTHFVGIELRHSMKFQKIMIHESSFEW